MHLAKNFVTAGSLSKNPLSSVGSCRNNYRLALLCLWTLTFGEGRRMKTTHSISCDPLQTLFPLTTALFYTNSVNRTQYGTFKTQSEMLSFFAQLCFFFFGKNTPSELLEHVSQIVVVSLYLRYVPFGLYSVPALFSVHLQRRSRASWPAAL